ncbi:MAG TPA: phosphoglucomutase/phosphomannomutase family protein [Acidobacteriaceae bacterium]|jgi:phosphomannomutase|nr:phosphoglucomutase/phosphomannomutase family protein [Acidobacteriaceae bacterium]
MPLQKPIKFGTDGWRGVIADDFTFENVRIAAAAIANYVLENEDANRGVYIGYDTRFGSARFARAAAEVVAGAGIPVCLSSGVTPTPALSYAIHQQGAAGGIMITSSHNPCQWNGVKYKASYGGSGKPSIMARIEALLGKPISPAAKPAEIALTDFHPAYVKAITRFADMQTIAGSGYRFVIDDMYGAGAGVLAGIFSQASVPFVEIRKEPDPLFPGINPEPIAPHLRAAQDAVIEHRCQAGLITDGDADRLGAVDERGNVVDAHKIFCILLRWLIERKQWPGEVVRAFNTTRMIDRICARHGRKLHEVGIGFKYVCDLMLERDILMGGEESGGMGITRHLPERDGLLNALLLANVMADEQRTLGELVADLQREYGEHYYGRIDLHIAEDVKNAAIVRAQAGVKEFSGMAVERMETLDGIKFYLKNPEAATKPNVAETWLLLRASGTEPLLRIYAESCSQESVDTLLEAARTFALQAGGAA